MLRGAQCGGEREKKKKDGRREKKNRGAGVKKRNITVVRRFFEMDSWGQVKDN